MSNVIFLFLIAVIKCLFTNVIIRDEIRLSTKKRDEIRLVLVL